MKCRLVASTTLAMTLAFVQAATAKSAPKLGAGSLLVDQVVAVVNGAVILESELQRRLAPLSFELRNIRDERERARKKAKLRAQLAEEMINEELIVQAAARAKITVTDSEVQSAFSEIKNQNKFDDAHLAVELAKQGYTPASYRQDVRRQLMRMHAIYRLVRPKIKIAKEDVRARYDEKGRRSARISKVHLKHVLLAMPRNPSQKERAQAKARAATVIEKARTGSDFSELAKQYSDDLKTRETGGDLGWIERGNLDTEWEVIIFAMDVGEIRGPINGPSGLHVFYVADVERSERKPFDQVKDKLRSELFRREMDRQTRQWLRALRKKAHIELKT